VPKNSKVSTREMRSMLWREMPSLGALFFDGLVVHDSVWNPRCEQLKSTPKRPKTSSANARRRSSFELDGSVKKSASIRNGRSQNLLERQKAKPVAIATPLYSGTLSDSERAAPDNTKFGHMVLQAHEGMMEQERNSW